LETSFGFTSELGTRRFRFGGEKEAAGVAVAVMWLAIMEIESLFLIDSMVYGAAMVADGESERSAME
jgi:hypothetical protein